MDATQAWQSGSTAGFALDCQAVTAAGAVQPAADAVAAPAVAAACRGLAAGSLAKGQEKARWACLLASVHLVPPERRSLLALPFCQSDKEADDPSTP